MKDQSFLTNPSISPTTLVDFGEKEEELKRNLKKHVKQTQDYYDLSAFINGDVIPSEAVIEGIENYIRPEEEEKEDYEIVGQKRKQTSSNETTWIPIDVLILYITWEQCWWTRTPKGKIIPLSVLDLYKIVYHEYKNMGPRGTIRDTKIKKERHHMRRIHNMEYPEPKEDNNKKPEGEKKGEEEEEFQKIGLPPPPKESKLYTLEYLEEKRRERKQNPGSYWWKNVPTAKREFSLTYKDILIKLLEFEKEGLLTVRPVRASNIPFVNENKKPNSPRDYLMIFFSEEKGYDIWNSLNGIGTPVPSIVKNYHKQRLSRYSYFSDCTLIGGNIYNSISKQIGLKKPRL